VLAFTDRGAGPSAIFLHGIGSDRHRWSPVVELLVDDLRCVSVDLPGHGESPSDGCDAISAATAVHEVVEALDLGPTVVVGHSLGGNVALVLGALYAPRSVVAVDPVPLHLPHLADGLAPYADRLQGDDFEAAFLEWEHDRFGLDQPEALHPCRETVLAYWSSTLRREDAEALQPQFADALAAIAVPTLVVLGDRPTPEDADVLATMSTTTVDVFDGLGHFLHLADAPRFADRLRAWVAALP
jgi:pimeloyl-ACP methyl ester carboxylesterase